jgi:flagellar biosynthesis/type III secretory pathway chaperone
MEGKVAQAESPPLTKHAAAQLVAGYSEESVLYQMLFGLTSRQRRCLGDGGNLGEFVELIEQKDSILDQIEKLEIELAPLRASWMASPRSNRESLAERLNPLFDEVISTIQKTVAVEQGNERLLESRQRELTRVLADAHKWRSEAPAPAAVSHLNVPVLEPARSAASTA